MTKTFHRFVFVNESLLAKAALELKFWHIQDSAWWLGSTTNSLVTRDSNVIDVITETFGFANNGHNDNYHYTRITNAEEKG